MNDESNGERTAIERDANERMRELGRRSGEARRRKRERRDQELELDENGVPVDIKRWSMQRLVKLGNSDSNIAARHSMESLEHERLTESVHSRRIAFVRINLALVSRHSKQVGISSSGRMCDAPSGANSCSMKRTLCRECLLGRVTPRDGTPP